MVGGGIIGLAVAWRAVRQGLDVTVYDPAPGSGASWASAGMLAPDAEAHFGEELLRPLLLDSLGRWPAFAAELAAESGHDLGYVTDGTLLVALTDDDLREVERMRAYTESVGGEMAALPGRRLRELEPLLSPRVRGGAWAPQDVQVDPRRVVAALLDVLDGRVVRQPVPDVGAVDADRVVVAAGCGSLDLAGLPVRPVKGQILRLYAPGTTFRRVIRGLADGRPVYLVPRPSGEVVVGATVEERGYDVSVTAGAVHELLRAAVDLIPGLAEYELVETRAGLRPGTPDNLPILGARDDRVIVATGHHRHGVVLTPVTADSIAELLATGAAPAVIGPFTPGRFR